MGSSKRTIPLVTISRRNLPDAAGSSSGAAADGPRSPVPAARPDDASFPRGHRLRFPSQAASRSEPSESSGLPFFSLVQTSSIYALFIPPPSFVLLFSSCPSCVRLTAGHSRRLQPDFFAFCLPFPEDCIIYMLSAIAPAINSKTAKRRRKILRRRFAVRVMIQILRFSRVSL